LLWWLAIAAAVADIAWAAVTWRDEPRPWVPLVVLAAGLAVALVLPLLLVPIARRRARRYRKVVTARLQEAALTIAREVVTPVRQILGDYAEARAALAEAKQPR
jgi:membrane protein YdbS with pleckstrin-like domain